jgi:hypothetical protein
MSKVNRRRAGRNGAPIESLPLFDFADALHARQRWQHATLPARSLARRYGLALERAELLATLAGLGARDER